MITQWTLDADVYDALELSAEAHGGVGAGAYFDFGGPLCIIGHASFLDNVSMAGRLGRQGFAEDTLRAAYDGVLANASDAVVCGAAKGGARISFQLWAERIGCVRYAG